MPVALLVPALQLLNPMPGVVTQDAHAEHPALDIACAVGTPVRAAHDGVATVVRSHTHGNTVVLVGNNGLETSYSHLHSTQAPGTYKRGDLIGLCGNTGIWTTGPHLHFETNRPALLSNLDTSFYSDIAQQPSTPSAEVTGIGGSPAALAGQN
ncbi:M23 family metallopeptidase [Synechococcus sp. W4D4]|uniref:M23 family metallopeptidase n=1 Tax=Synechococcus sp. W4D4 TaxID=3392294 RepID=UPI0039EAD513